jgi:hypothetical protein
MAYVSGFTNDIFFSYASIDNEPDAQDVRWVSHFRNDLATALRRRLGSDVEIFFDEVGLRAYHDLDALIENARKSAAFLAVFSPSYVERQWTRDELQAFHETAKRSGEPNRIITIEILPVEASRLPPEIENLKRTRFYRTDRDSGTELQLSPASDPIRYNERVQQLAQHLVLLLRDMRKRGESEGAGERDRNEPARAPTEKAAMAKAPALDKPRTVMLAQVNDDLYDERQKVNAYLEDYGLKVIPEGEYPENGSKFAAAVAADLDRADLFVQLLSRYRSPRPGDLRGDGEQSKSHAQFQFDAAIRRGIKILQWRHPDISPDKVPAINWDRHLLDGPDVRVMGLQEFMKEIWAAIAGLEQARPAPNKGDFFFINADRNDQDLAQTLAAAFNANNYYASIPMYDGSAKEIEEDLEANLIDCKGLLLIYGKSSLAWVRAQLRRFIKLENRRKEPLHLKSILFGPPAPKAEVGVTGFEMIDCQDGATLERVGKIIKELRL